MSRPSRTTAYSVTVVHHHDQPFYGLSGDTPARRNITLRSLTRKRSKTEPPTSLPPPASPANDLVADPEDIPQSNRIKTAVQPQPISTDYSTPNGPRSPPVVVQPAPSRLSQPLLNVPPPPGVQPPRPPMQSRPAARAVLPLRPLQQHPHLDPGTHSRKAPSPFPLSLRQFTLALSKTRNASASPVTPVDQILPTTPLSPPPLQANCPALSKPLVRKPRLPAPLRMALHSDFVPESPLYSPVLGLGLDFSGTPCISGLGLPSPFPFDGPLSAKPSLLPAPRHQIPSPAPLAPERDFTALKVLSTVGNCPMSAAPQAILRARIRPPVRLSLPRRLSYNRPGLAGSPGSAAPTPKKTAEELASPAVIDPQPGPGPKPAGLPRRKAGTPATPNLHAHLPRMIELGSYF
ncbi:uncharacterized protein B0H18DRAFT_1121610 [Fomitopsis serialis]|uniref:uncharacterized protein n=1 Tax=Fomitopsis serialis TaxID=139415 RepID=UPI00200892FB|nr:uncharacterized protein B0H18DRAFT_1121610 [Neoantrodia serialis]KAH9921042.1 hypothetical protein B0H18DRAFT_1121610 [Neoantrodia serialis]